MSARIWGCSACLLSCVEADLPVGYKRPDLEGPHPSTSRVVHTIRTSGHQNQNKKRPGQCRMWAGNGTRLYRQQPLNELGSHVLSTVSWCSVTLPLSAVSAFLGHQSFQLTRCYPSEKVVSQNTIPWHWTAAEGGQTPESGGLWLRWSTTQAEERLSAHSNRLQPLCAH